MQAVFDDHLLIKTIINIKIVKNNIIIIVVNISFFVNNASGREVITNTMTLTIRNAILMGMISTLL